MLPVAHEGRVYQLGVAVEWQDDAGFLRLATGFDELHVGELCRQVAEQPAVQLAPLGVVAFCYVLAVVLQDVLRIVFSLRKVLCVCDPCGQVDGDLVAKLVLGVVAVACALFCHGVGAVAVVLASDGDLGGEVYGDAMLVMLSWLALILQVVHALVLGKYAEVGRDEVLPFHRVAS